MGLPSSTRSTLPRRRLHLPCRYLLSLGCSRREALSRNSATAETSRSTSVSPSSSAVQRMGHSCDFVMHMGLLPWPLTGLTMGRGQGIDSGTGCRCPSWSTHGWMDGWRPWHTQVHCALQRLGAPKLVSAAATRKQRRRLHGARRGPGNFIKSKLSCVIRKAKGMWEAAALHHADLTLSAYDLALPVEATSSLKRSQHVSGRTMGFL